MAEKKVIESRTTVVNLHHTNKCDLVCDRRSIYGNPYDYQKLGITREESIDLYRMYFKKRILTDASFRAKVHLLKGKCLGCWCVPEYKCHLEVIVEYLENI